MRKGKREVGVGRGEGKKGRWKGGEEERSKRKGEGVEIRTKQKHCLLGFMDMLGSALLPNP